MLHKPEAEGKKPETEINEQSSDTDQNQNDSFEIIPQEQVTESEEEIEHDKQDKPLTIRNETNSMMESEEEIEIDEEEKPLTIIDETLTYFDHNLCIVHPGDKCFEKKRK